VSSADQQYSDTDRRTVPTWAGNASLYLDENDQIYSSCVLGIFSQNCIRTRQHTGRVMRISDDRYSRERLCLDLALRFFAP
jgi:hypothetical protein